jgi:hypothetical protein
MGLVKKHPPCVQFIAAFSRHETALEWFWERVSQRLAPIAIKSPLFPFSESAYYHRTMGDSLKKQFAILSPWYDPAELPSHKLLMHDWEDGLQKDGAFAEPRPINIDPGYMSMTKLVLASTKNREHRLYLREGIYAEVTLAFRDQQWQPMPWTYPDYQREDFRLFFHDCRSHLAKNVAALLRAQTISSSQSYENE